MTLISFAEKIRLDGLHERTNLLRLLSAAILLRTKT